MAAINAAAGVSTQIDQSTKQFGYSCLATAVRRRVEAPNVGERTAVETDPGASSVLSSREKGAEISGRKPVIWGKKGKKPSEVGGGHTRSS